MMNLWLSSHLLVAGLFLSSSALTPEECQPLVSPLSLADPSMYYGRWNHLVGYNDNEGYVAMLKATESSWLNITGSPINLNAVVTGHNKMNGTCLLSVVNSTFDNETVSVSLPTIASRFHLLPSCDGCMLMNINATASHLDKLFHMLRVKTNVTGEEVHFRALYLMTRESTLKDSVMEDFKQQASCLGFSREPDFLHDPKNDFCAEGEDVDIKTFLKMSN